MKNEWEFEFEFILYSEKEYWPNNFKTVVLCRHFTGEYR